MGLFEYRTKKYTGGEAFIWYLFAFVTGVILIFLIGSVYSLMILAPSNAAGDDGFEFGILMGQLMATILSPVIALMVLSEKKDEGNGPLLVLSVLNIFAGYYGGLLLGLILPAYFTTLEPKKNKKKRTA